MDINDIEDLKSILADIVRLQDQASDIEDTFRELIERFEKEIE